MEQDVNALNGMDVHLHLPFASQSGRNKNYNIPIQRTLGCNEMSKRSQRNKDPHQSREKSKYGAAIPSREYILTKLEEIGSPQYREQLVEVLDLHEDWEHEALRRRLRAMVRDGQLIFHKKKGYAPAPDLDVLPGTVTAHPDGFGFLIPDRDEQDVYLAPREMRRVFHGDRVTVQVTGVDARGRRQGRIAEVLERNTDRIVGRLHCENEAAFVVPEDRRINHDIAVQMQDCLNAKSGQIVVVHITQQPDLRQAPQGRVVEVLGEHMAPGMEIDIAIRAHEIPTQWPDGTEDELRAFGDHVSDQLKQERADYRDLPFVTIDGADARDFDDAVYCERKPKGWRLMVAIADVSQYVQPDTALDDGAVLRGTSVYFPQRVVPMLPEALSNGLCSLNPKVDRLTMVAELYISQTGELMRSRFTQAVICSKARLLYDEVAAMVVDKDRAARAKHATVVNHLDELYRLFKVLLRARVKRGAIDFESSETQIIFGEHKKIEKIVAVTRNDAHRMIEECMILANVAAARFLHRHKMPAMYRVHEAPQPDKVTSLRSFLQELGLRLMGGDQPKAKDYANLLKRIKDRGDYHLIQTVMLRSLSQAVYKPANLGHFGLALPAYVHFTSPIRRYPDLMVHRAIRHVLQGGTRETFAYTDEEMIRIANHCSQTERRADEATRDTVDWLKCEFMRHRIGQSFTGFIAAVTSFGLFVEIEENYIQGLVHISSLRSDYYQYDAVGHRLVGDRTRRIYRLGDNVQVSVVRVDLDDRKIDFELTDQPAQRQRKKKQRTNKRRKKSR